MKKPTHPFQAFLTRKGLRLLLIVPLLVLALLATTLFSPSGKAYASTCTPNSYHLVSYSYILPYTMYVEIYADGCGWVQAHVHSDSPAPLRVELDRESDNSIVTYNDAGETLVTDLWTYHVSTGGAYYYAEGIDNSNVRAFSASTSSANGYYYPCSGGSC